MLETSLESIKNSQNNSNDDVKNVNRDVLLSLN